MAQRYCNALAVGYSVQKWDYGAEQGGATETSGTSDRRDRDNLDLHNALETAPPHDAFAATDD